MDDNQFHVLMIALGFGFGSLFWPFLWWLLFKAR